jgi:3-deoxy-D-manno-octulosonic-acid transferase
MRFLYSVILYCLSPVIILRLLWRSTKTPAYRKRLAERFAYQCRQINKPVIWLHAVSVGETLAAVPLLQSLLEKYPTHAVLVTTTTLTGSEQVREAFADRVLHVYAPYDLPGAVNRFLDCFRPEIGIIMETEIWPNLFHACQQRRVPVILANARLSEKSARGYHKVLPLTRSTLQAIHTIASQTSTDALRFRQLGARDEQLQVTGSIKFDLKLPASLLESAEVLRRELGQHRPVWIAASTHEGEEEQIVDVYQQLQRIVDDLLLVLVPRHPERFDRAAALCKKKKLPFVRRSSGQPCGKDTRIYLADTMGELLLLYAAADMAFVGGSLVPVGGHNLLEPAALGVATVTGPYMRNFEEITSRLLECNGLVQVSDANQLVSSAEMLLRDACQRSQLGENAKAYIEANRGALDRLQQLIDRVMADNKSRHALQG